MRNQPIYWTKDMPAYHSAAGWEFEKARATEIVLLRVKFNRLDKMLEKADMMFKSAYAAKDSRLMCKYQLITIRLYEASNRIAERLIFEFKQEKLY